MTKRLVVALCLSVAIAGFGCGGGGGGGGGDDPAVPELATTVVTGKILDSRSNPVASATVTITSDPIVTITGPDGTFSVDLVEGEHLLTASIDGVTFCEITFTVGSVAIDMGDITPTTSYFPAIEAPTAYTMTELAPLPGGTVAYAYAINETGTVVGYSFQSSGSAVLWSGSDVSFLFSGVALGINDLGQVAGQHNADGTHAMKYAVTWENGTVTELEPLGTGFSTGLAINNAGQVVGYGYADQSFSANHAILWANDTTATDLGEVGEDGGANDINEMGQVVGYDEATPGTLATEFNAFLYEGGTKTELGTLGGDYSSAQAINNIGQIVGHSSTGEGEYHSCLWETGSISDLGTLGGTESWPYAINNAGHVVGSSTTEGGSERAYIWSNGTMTDLNDLIQDDSGIVLTAATDINEAGQIIAVSETYFPYSSRAFLLNPAE